MRKASFGFAFYCSMLVSVAIAHQSQEPQQTPSKGTEASCPMHKEHTHMNQRGEKGMGFSQTATTHHFLQKSDGGAIQVEANDPADVASRDNIRAHLAHIAQAFARGDFDIPMFVHDTVPPGVPDMKRLRDKIRYSFQETPRGGSVLISTTDTESLDAVHKFLRFQIEEHKTGDPIDAR
jgi:hypothetical protein